MLMIEQFAYGTAARALLVVFQALDSDYSVELPLTPTEYWASPVAGKREAAPVPWTVIVRTAR